MIQTAHDNLHLLDLGDGFDFGIWPGFCEWAGLEWEQVAAWRGGVRTENWKDHVADRRCTETHFTLSHNILSWLLPQNPVSSVFCAGGVRKNRPVLARTEATLKNGGFFHISSVRITPVSTPRLRTTSGSFSWLHAGEGQTRWAGASPHLLGVWRGGKDDRWLCFSCQVTEKTSHVQEDWEEERANLLLATGLARKPQSLLMVDHGVAAR